MFNLPRSLVWTIRFVVACLIIFSLCRLILFLTNLAVFSELSLGMTLHAFLHGLRFDLSILLVVTGIPLFLLALPIKAPGYFRVVALLAVILAMAMFFCLISDVVFFQQTDQHLSDQIFEVGDDLPYFVKVLVLTYWYWLLGYLLLFYFLVRRTWRFARRPNYPFPWWGQIAQVVVTLLVLWMGINGQVGIRIPRMVRPTDAFTYSQLSYGNLVLNGPFSVMRSLAYSHKIKPAMPSAEAEQTVLAAHHAPEAVAVNPRMPLGFKLQQFHAPDLSQKPLNVLIILVESLDAELVSSYQELGYTDPTIPPNLTPHLDRLASAGLRITSFFPNTVKSILGFESLMTGFSPLPGIPDLGHGLEIANVMRLGNVFKKHGYHTFFATSPHYDSFWFNTTAHSIGLDDSLAMEDFERRYSQENTYNGWDGETFAGMAAYLKKSKRPFFGMIFTGTMHMPFLIPEQKFAVVEHDNEGRGGLINTTFYFDAMLGEFVAALENEPWWKDTLLIITADHRSGRFIGPKSSIPLIFYAPQYLKPQVKKVLSSQVDFVPTIFDLFRWDHPYAGIGRSIFAPGPRLVVQRDGDVMGLIQEKPEAFLQMKAGQLINSTLGPAETAAGQKFILALQQVLMETFAQRRVCPDQD